MLDNCEQGRAGLTEEARCDPGFRRCVPRPALDWETFSRDWAEVHAPLARWIPGLRSNAQRHSRQAFSGGEKACDATLALWFDDVRALRAAFAPQEGQAALAGNANGIDHDRTKLTVGAGVTGASEGRP